jgi:large subunit ribosomal protein L1
MSISKKRKAAQGKLDQSKLYSLKEASSLVKEVNCTKFDSSVDLHIRLGVDPKKADQAVRGTVTLPHGTGKTKKVLVLCTPDKENDARAAGADFVGLDEFIQKIEGGWTDVDVIIATPSVMPKIGKLGKILGPRNLMPNPKTGTVTNAVRSPSRWTRPVSYTPPSGGCPSVWIRSPRTARSSSTPS